MSQITRRTFGLAAGAAAAAILTSRKGLSFASQERKVEIQLGAEIGTIRPELHGHFAEHLGSCVYGGLWVGKDSKVANINGYRKDAVEYLKAVGVPVLRWPGGCFADDYHWRDGIGPLAKRPRSVNLHWGKYTEDNSFGTHEFMGLCRLIGAAPYLAGNVGSGTPRELRDWMEYCNFAGDSSLAQERAANGSPAPFGVKYWGVGNENWGCGGNMSGEEYAEHYRRFVTFLRPFDTPPPFFIACGSNKNDAAWTRGFFEGLRKRGPVGGFAMHFYSSSRKTPLEFTAQDTATQLASFAELEQAILDQRALMNTWDPEKRIGLLVDEWGVWDRMIPAEEKKYGRLFQQITMRSAVAAAMGLNVFHRQADKVVMANIAQMVNVLHSLLLTEDEKTVRTTTYYTYELMKAHRGKASVKTATGDSSPLGLSVSASKQGKELVITLANPRTDGGMSVTCSLAGGAAASGAARVIHHNDINAFNGFEHPDAVVPQGLAVGVQGSSVRIELPPLAVATAVIRLA
jgi:alpha-L-arabinofuranosidase